jgi:hypothetical protein
MGLAERRRGLVSQLEEMRGKLIEVADDLARPIEEAARADAEDSDLAETPDATDASDATSTADDAGDAETPVDPRYEDLWVQKDESLQIPDLASIDLEFDEPDE